MLPGVLPWSLCLLLLPPSRVQAFDVTPRWGQAVALLDGFLFVHGGKTDQFNSFSYTSAPNINDLLYLPLINPFSVESPPWALVGGSANSSSLQGPFLSWHTLSPSNPSNVLLFGGYPDPNSATVVMSAADSAELLNVASPLDPVWSLEPVSWAGEPVRRMRHSTATSSSGRVFIVGGEKADGSGNALSDHFVFNPTVPSFTLLPSNGPPDIYGHASTILSDGRLLVFGGYSPSQEMLLPFSMIWVLDTSQTNLTWTLTTTATSPLPSPRMAFAAVSLDDGRVLIHGGSDTNLQTNFADGWILDTSQSTMNWKQIEFLSQLGARRDHFAVCQGNQVLFGFGYGNNGPAPATLQIYNSSSQSFASSFEPSLPTQATPTNSQTNKYHSKTSPPTPSSTSSSTTGNPNNPSGGPSASSSSKMRTIAISTTLGALTLIVVLLGTAYYLRRRQQGQGGDRRFIALEGDERDGADSLHFDGQIPAVSIRGDPVGGPHGWNRGLINSLGLSGAIGAATKMKNVGNTYQRRDMLADEDTRSFGEWYSSRGRDGTGGSSWSLKSMLGGGTRLLSREASTTSRGTTAGGRSTHWREKSDPFIDGPSPLRDEETSLMGVATASAPARSYANGRRQISRTSTKSGLSYIDPFADPVQEERRQRSDATDPLLEEEVGMYDSLRLSVRHVPVLPSLITTLPLSQGGHALSPLSERTSQHTLTIPESSTAASSHAHSSENVITPPGGSQSWGTSRTSVDPLPLSSTIISTTHNDMRRSDSWWTRFARTSLLDRRSSDASKASAIAGRLEIRDPKPPPRLDVIAENIHLVSSTDKNSRTSREEQQLPPQQQGPVLARVASMIYGTGHGKSMSSLRTADSEAIERMVGTMDVVQRIKTRSNSHRTTGSISSVGEMSRRSSLDAGFDSHASGGASHPVQATLSDDNLMMLSPPVQMLPLRSPGDNSASSRVSRAVVSQLQIAPTPSSPIGSPQPLPYKSGLISPSSPSVADRIQALERHVSLEQSPPPPATNTKYREERTKKRVTVDYGLVPRASLFVANPDSHRLSTASGDS